MNISVNNFWVSESGGIRTVSLWIRRHGKFSKPIYQDNKQTRLKPQDGEYYLRCAGKWEAVGSEPHLRWMPKPKKKNCCVRWSVAWCQSPRPCLI